MKTVVGGLLIMLAAATSHGANGAFTLQEENDVFAANHRTDRAYTNGARFLWDWTADRGSMQFLARNARRLCHTTLCETRLTLGVGQTMYTPQNLKATRPIAGDRPYGGWFFGVVMADALEQSTIDHVELYAGIIGPHAYSKTTQTAVHRAIHAQKPMGWANQISDRPGVLAVYERRFYAIDRKYFDITPVVRGAAGSVFDYFAGGGTARVGFNLPPRFLRAIPAVASLHRVATPSSSSWDAFLFATLDARVVAYNVFLDAADASYGISRKPFVYDRVYGASVRDRHVRLMYAHTIRSGEFDPDRRPHRYGTITITIGSHP
jgi:hypothetical protein